LDKEKYFSQEEEEAKREAGRNLHLVPMFKEADICTLFVCLHVVACT
jgi:hypothetical protein